MQNIEFNKKISAISSAEILFDEPMKNHTTFKIGGLADVFASVDNISALKEIVSLCRRENVPYHIIGAGSNLLVSDKGLRGVVIKYCERNVTYDGENIYASSGITLSALSKYAMTNSLSGLEFACGIPGLLGGAIYMNAGAYGGEMKDVIIKTKYLDTDGEIKTICGDNHDFSYRHSFFTSKELFILGAELKLTKGDKKEISATMNELLKKRNDKQPLNFPSAGSVFKRPEGYFAGKLIEDSGLKGYSIGGAQVSEKHAGFIVNAKDATAKDVLDLIEHIKHTVFKNFGVELTCEIKTMGEF